MIQDKLMIAQDFDAHFGRDGVPFRPVRRGWRRFGKDVRCRHICGKTLAKAFGVLWVWSNHLTAGSLRSFSLDTCS